MSLIEHEVWEDEEGKTMLCQAGKVGEEARQLLEPNSRLIHTFSAASHFEAMNTYYQLMEWGEYETIDEIDKQPYIG